MDLHSHWETVGMGQITGDTTMKVNTYYNTADFEAGIEKMQDKSWELHSWRMVLDIHGGLVIVAVFTQ
jgi:hypothetical protein